MHGSEYCSYMVQMCRKMLNFHVFLVERPAPERELMTTRAISLELSTSGEIPESS